MDYKKEYEAMVHRARELHEAGNFLTKKQMEIVCPELAESEDERTIKTIRQLLETARDAHSNTSLAKPFIDALAWLEKQKEQELPLMDGDADLYFDEWNQKHNPTRRQCFKEGMRYAKRLQEEQKPSCWDSPVMTHEMIMDEQKPAEWKPQPESLEALMYAIEGKWDMIKPTSYLSRRLEDLYEGLVNTFNVDELLLTELPKVASRAYTAKDIEELRALKDKIEASMEQKPAWQEVKGRRGRIGDTPEHIRKKAENFLSKMEPPYDADDICSAYETGAMENAKPAEWSEEDELMIITIIQTLETLGGRGTTGMQIDWLKSIRPQPHWKPSDEQMKALKYVNECVFLKDSRKMLELKTLYEQLKKL